MKKIGWNVLGLAVVIFFSKCNFSGSSDKYSFYRQYNDSLSFHVIGNMSDVGPNDIMFERRFMLINKRKQDSLSISLSEAEYLSVYIKLDSIEYDHSKHPAMFIENFGNSDGKIIDLATMKIVANSIPDSIVFDSTNLFLNKYSIELKRDL